MKDYIIWTPPFDLVTGGVKVLHRFCHELNERGVYAYVTTDVTNEVWNTPYILTAKNLTPDWVGVYPEVVVGNPLHSKRTARYILNNAGKLGGPKTFPENEALFVFSHLFNDFNLPDDRVLFLPTIELNIYHDKHQSREFPVYYVGKGKNTPRIKQTEDAFEITKEMVKNKKLIADLFNHATVFYCYDNVTCMTEMARLCGCPVVIIPTGEYTREHFNNNDVGLEGMGIGIEEEQQALATISSEITLQKYTALYEKFLKNLDRFIEITQQL